MWQKLIGDFMSETKRCGTVKQVAADYKFISESGLRWLIFNESNNGFTSCVRRIGRKVIIDYDSFEEWIDRQKEVA